MFNTQNFKQNYQFQKRMLQHKSYRLYRKSKKICKAKRKSMQSKSQKGSSKRQFAFIVHLEQAKLENQNVTQQATTDSTTSKQNIQRFINPTRYFFINDQLITYIDGKVQAASQEELFIFKAPDTGVFNKKQNNLTLLFKDRLTLPHETLGNPQYLIQKLIHSGNKKYHDFALLIQKDLELQNNNSICDPFLKKIQDHKIGENFCISKKFFEKLLNTYKDEPYLVQHVEIGKNKNDKNNYLKLTGITYSSFLIKMSQRTPESMMKLFFKQKAFVSEYEVPDFIDWAIIQMKQKNLYYQQIFNNATSSDSNQQNSIAQFMQYNPVFVKERDSTTPKLQKLPKLKELKTYFILESDNTISLKILQLLKVPNGSLKNKPTLVKFDFFQTAKQEQEVKKRFIEQMRKFMFEKTKKKTYNLNNSKATLKDQLNCLLHAIQNFE